MRVLTVITAVAVLDLFFFFCLNVFFLGRPLTWRWRPVRTGCAPGRTAAATPWRRRRQTQATRNQKKTNKQTKSTTAAFQRAEFHPSGSAH